MNKKINVKFNLISKSIDIRKEEAGFLYGFIMNEVKAQLKASDRKLDEESDIEVLITVNTIPNE